MRTVKSKIQNEKGRLPELHLRLAPHYLQQCDPPDAVAANVLDPPDAIVAGSACAAIVTPDAIVTATCA